MQFHPNKLFVVWGETGRHSDFREWAVCAYTEKEMADTHAAKANDWLVENKLHYLNEGPGWQKPSLPVNPYDTEAGYDTDYGSKYTVGELSLFLHLDQFLEQQ